MPSGASPRSSARGRTSRGDPPHEFFPVGLPASVDFGSRFSRSCRTVRSFDPSSVLLHFFFGNLSCFRPLRPLLARCSRCSAAHSEFPALLLLFIVPDFPDPVGRCLDASGASLCPALCRSVGRLPAHSGGWRRCFFAGPTHSVPLVSRALASSVIVLAGGASRPVDVPRPHRE